MSLSTTKPQYICLAAGGTGGHVMPAICIAERLLAEGHQILLLTDKRGAKLIPAHLPYKRLASASPFSGSVIRRLGAMIQLAGGLVSCLITLAGRRPTVLLGFGGYPAAAPIFAAWCLKIPAIMHEQNAVIGRTNLMLARFTKALLASWPKNKGKLGKTPVIHTGLPVRERFTAIKPYKPNPSASPFQLAIFGGSLGAALFAEIIPSALAQLPATDRRRLKVTQQVREEQKKTLDEFYHKQGISAETRTFFDDVDEVMARADLIITRAGASSVAEIACAGRPAIFIPFAKAMDNHQQANAEQLCAHKGGLLLAEADLGASELSQRIATLMEDKSLRLEMAKNASACAKKDAAAMITDHLLSYRGPQNKEAA